MPYYWPSPYSVYWCIAGRNIHALDPYRMPSPAALARGTAVADAILAQHRAANAGAWPETLAVRGLLLPSNVVYEHLPTQAVGR